MHSGSAFSSLSDFSSKPKERFHAYSVNLQNPETHVPPQRPLSEAFG